MQAIKANPDKAFFASSGVGSMGHLVGVVLANEPPGTPAPLRRMFTNIDGAADEMARMVELAEQNDFASARRIHGQLMPLMSANFVESNPIPVKAAMAAMGLLEEVYRLPMVPPQPISMSSLCAPRQRMRSGRSEA